LILSVSYLCTRLYAKIIINKQKIDLKKRDPKKNTPFANKRKPKLPPQVDPDEDMRLNKYVAHCGIAARRKASEYIMDGLVTVNGEVVREPGHRVKPEDKVTYRGKPIEPETQRMYILLNKPKNTVTTVSDEKGRRTVMDLLDPNIKLRIYPVGRLDRETTGLLLLTNDGDLAKKLSHPSHEVTKIYHVTLDKPVTAEHMEAIRNTLTLADGPVPVDEISYVKNKDKNEVGIEIHIGRNRIVRRIFQHLGYLVVRLDRTYYAGLTKKDIPRGKHRLLNDREVLMLKHFV